MEYTKGEWKAIKASSNPDDWEWKVMSIEIRIPLTIAEKLNEANAQLIASAPACYKLIKDTVRKMDGGVWSYEKIQRMFLEEGKVILSMVEGK